MVKRYGDGVVCWSMPNHFNLRVYGAACELSRTIHECIEAHPVSRVPGLRAQLLESVGSIAANTAEGAGHGSPGKFVNHLRMALGSANEVRTHLHRAKDEANFPLKPFYRCDSKALVTARMLASLIRRIEETDARLANEALSKRSKQ